MAIDYQLIAKNQVYKYAKDHLDKSDPPLLFTINDVFVVWFCRTLQNWKALLSTSLPDATYYEVTFNGDTEVIYLDVYKKFDNIELDGLLPPGPPQDLSFEKKEDPTIRELVERPYTALSYKDSP